MKLRSGVTRERLVTRLSTKVHDVGVPRNDCRDFRGPPLAEQQVAQLVVPRNVPRDPSSLALSRIDYRPEGRPVRCCSSSLLLFFFGLFSSRPFLAFTPSFVRDRLRACVTSRVFDSTWLCRAIHSSYLSLLVLKHVLVLYIQYNRPYGRSALCKCQAPPSALLGTSARL